MYYSHAKGDSSTTTIGRANEAKAVAFLEARGLEIVEQNYFARKLGEIDIVARQDGVFHFVEVKSAQADFDPIYNFTPRKQRKMINAVHYYLKTKGLDCAFSIDLILIRGDEVEWLENVTL